MKPLPHTAERKRIRVAIRAEMLRRGITTADLAQVMPWGERYIDKVIQGERAPKAARQAIEAFFGTPFWKESHEKN